MAMTEVEMMVRRYVQVAMTEFTALAKQDISDHFVPLERDVVDAVEKLVNQQRALTDRIDVVESQVFGNIDILNNLPVQMRTLTDRMDIVESQASKINQNIEDGVHGAMCKFAAIVKQDVAACIEHDVLDVIPAMQDSIIALSDTVTSMQNKEDPPSPVDTPREISVNPSPIDADLVGIDQEEQLQKALKVRELNLDKIQRNMGILETKKNLLLEQVKESSRTLEVAQQQQHYEWQSQPNIVLPRGVPVSTGSSIQGGSMHVRNGSSVTPFAAVPAYERTLSPPRSMLRAWSDLPMPASAPLVTLPTSGGIAGLRSRGGLAPHGAVEHWVPSSGRLTSSVTVPPNGSVIVR